ncbi:MAG TPA: hypothetical protein VKY89_08715 [Thermoanaerobaculia bacterium]|nr:hypothetical protein [Thermoanaerobaculia bacterium]
MPPWSILDLAPGCYAAVLALLLVTALRRWYEPVPWRVLAAFALAVGVLFGSSLFGGRVLLPLDDLRGEVPFRLLRPSQPSGNVLQGDLIELVVPSLAAGRSALAAGRWPLWNSRVGAGMPLLADPQAQALAPVALLALPFSPLRGAAVMAALRVIVALVFTFLLLRRQGLGEGPALAGALAFGLSGFLLLWVGWPLASAAALLPAVLYALARLAAVDWPAAEARSATQPAGAGPPRRDALLLALALASLLLAGHPETELYACLLAAAFAVDLVLRRPAGQRLAVLRRMAGATAVAAGLAAPALLPALDYLPQTLRASRLAHPAAAAAAAGGDLARRWLPIVAPNAYGNSRFAAYWGLSNTNEDAAGFAGTAAALGAALAVAAPRRRRLPQESLMLAVLGVCLLQLADPGWLHALLAAIAPALAGSRRCLALVAFCLAYLAACTWERHRRGELGRAPLIAVAAALGALIAWAYLDHPSPGDPQRLAVLRFGWLRWQARFLIAATLLLALPGGRRLSRRGHGGFLGAAMAAGLAAVVGVELLLAHLPANPPMPARLAFPRPPPLALPAGRPGGDRIAALGRGLPPNLASLYGLTDARIYNPVAPAAYLALLAPITTGWWGEMPELGSPGDPLYRRLGVGYLLVAPGERPPPPWTLLIADPSGWLYRRADAWPRLYLAASAGAGAGGEPQPGRLAVTSFEDDEIAARARIDGGGAVLAGSLYQDGGWRLLVDGRQVPEPLPGRLLAAPLRLPGSSDRPRSTPKAPHAELRLDLLYRPRGFLAGMVAAALACAGALAGWTPGPRGSRRLGSSSQDHPTGGTN